MSETGSDNGLASDGSKRTMDLELFGQRLSVVSDNDEEMVRDIVDFVNRRLESIRDGGRHTSDQIALLAALNIAEELFEERHEHAQLRRTVREKSVRLLSSIDDAAREIEASQEREEP